MYTKNKHLFQFGMHIVFSSISDQKKNHYILKMCYEIKATLNLKGTLKLGTSPVQINILCFYVTPFVFLSLSNSCSLCTFANKIQSQDVATEVSQFHNSFTLTQLGV